MTGSIAVIFGVIGLIIAAVQAAMAIGYGFSKDTSRSMKTGMFVIAAMAGVLFVMILGLTFMAHSKHKKGGLAGSIGELAAI